MKEKENLSQIAVKFDLDIIYAFGSHAKEVSEWVKGKRSVFSVEPSSDLDIGVRLCPGRRMSVRKK